MQFQHTRIVVTLGPASTDKKIIAKMVQLGARVFRLNASHGDHESHRQRYNLVREVEEETGIPLSVMMDLQGPKIRVSTFKEGCVTLMQGQTFRLTSKTVVGDETQVTLPHPELFQALEVGHSIRLNDGLIEMKVTALGDDFVDCKVLNKGVLSDRKGVNVPQASLPISALTERDKKDLKFGLELGADWIALSFVQNPEDVKTAIKLIDGRARVLSKIEKPNALKVINEIIELSDAIMMARGDLGVELDPELVPGVQKAVVAACRCAGKPVIVATQMLESMIVNPTPTRAEVSDVSTALYDGADGVMLSAETASGKYPIEAVGMMQRIIFATEREKNYWRIIGSPDFHCDPVPDDAVVEAASDVAKKQKCQVLTCYTATGNTALRASRLRNKTPILGLTPFTKTARALAMVWGVYSVKTKDVSSFEEMQAKATRIAKREKLAKDGDNLVVTAGVPFGVPGTTNVLRRTRVGDYDKTS